MNFIFRKYTYIWQENAKVSANFLRDFRICSAFKAFGMLRGEQRQENRIVGKKTIERRKK